MIVHAGRQRLPLRRDAVDVASLVRRLDVVLLLAAAALVGYGLWAVAGITRFDVAGDPGYFVTVRRSPRRSAASGSSSPSSSRRASIGATGVSCTRSRSG